MSVFRKKSIQLFLLLPLISASLFFSNTKGVYSQQSVIIPGIVSSPLTSTNPPATTILEAIAGKNDLCSGFPCSSNPMPATTSTSIRFVVSGNIVSTSDLPIKRFECSLDNARFSSCSNVTPVQTIQLTLPGYSDLAIGSHTFKVRAVNTADIVDPNAPEFTWTIASNVTNTVTTVAQTPTVASNSANVLKGLAQNALAQSENAQVSNTSRNNAKGDTILGMTNAAVSATLQANALNPPLLKCNVANFDLSIYKIEGTANLKKLFENTKGLTSVPVVFQMLENTNPQSSENMIIDHNNQIITAKFVVFPGDIYRQRVVDVELTKINTECKATALISSQEVIKGGLGNKPSQPAIIVPRLETVTLNPPFSQCIGAKPNGANPPGTNKVTDSLGQAAQAELQSSSSTGSGALTFSSSTASLLSSSSLATAIKSNPSLAAAIVMNPSLAQNLVRNQTTTVVKPPPSTPSLFGGNTGLAQLLGNTIGGTPEGQGIPDVAKYVIRGEINPSRLIELSGNQKLAITMYVDLAPQNAPSIKPLRIIDSNNIIAATLQTNQGKTGDWGVSSLLLDEIYTACDTIPFVSRPMAIGDDSPSDFTTQVVSDCSKQHHCSPPPSP